MDTIWGNGTFSNSLQIWLKNYKKPHFKLVVGLVSWNIWKIRNLIFFESAAKSVDVVVEILLKSFKELGPIPSKLEKSLKRGPNFPPNCPWICFYGACLNGHCGGGIAIFLSDIHYLAIQLGASRGTNSKAELLTL